MALMCCSNGDTDLPSSVQCPELWTPGRSSFTSSVGSPGEAARRHLHRQHAHVFESVGDLRCDLFLLRLDRIRSRAGTREGLHDVLRCSFSSRQNIRLAVGAARGDHRDLALDGMNCSRIAELVPSLGSYRLQVGGAAYHRICPSVIAEAACLQHGWQAKLGIASRSVSTEKKKPDTSPPPPHRVVFLSQFRAASEVLLFYRPVPW